MFISVVSNMATAPFELIKVRSQLVQEGKILHGFGVERGVPFGKIAAEILANGYGLKHFWTG